MAKQTINQGTAPTGAGGDTFRSGSAKLQANDDELYSQLGATAQGILPSALPVSKGGTGATSATAARTSLGLGTAATAAVQTDNYDSISGRLLTVGAFGLGGSSAYNAGDATTYTPLHQLRAGFFLYSDSHPETPPNNHGFASYGINCKKQSLNFGAILWMPYSSYGHPAITSYSLSSRVHHYIYTDRNTTVDANGFVKKASPIVKLFADRIELNDEAQQQDISFEKLGVGDYLIKGSSGFSQEGWYIETPKDANGNVLFSVIYTTPENGDISVKTYKKKFDLETASIVADLNNPVDITESRWIDLRLQELPQPEIEEPESIAPPDFQPTGLAEAVAAVMESYHDPEQ